MARSFTDEAIGGEAPCGRSGEDIV